MKIQRHVRQDFQPVYIKLETLTEVENLLSIMGVYIGGGDAMVDPLRMAKDIGGELQTITDAGGILP